MATFFYILLKKSYFIHRRVTKKRARQSLT
jgi:hypothetical protein